MKQAMFFLILLIVVSLSFGHLLFFDLWQDDNALIFKLQHINESVGFFGPGLLGLGAYRYIAVPYYFLYQIFGLNLPFFYFFAILFYFLASLSIYFLTKELTKNLNLAFSSSAIFASGFIGSDGIIRLFNSIQTSYSVILVCLVFIFLYRATDKRFYLNLFLSYLFFYLSLELSYIRTQYLILPVFIFVLIFFKKQIKIIANLPFLIIYYFIFLQNPDNRTNLIYEFLQNLLQLNFDYTFTFFANIGNIILAKPLNYFLFSISSKVSLDLHNQLLILQFFTIFLTLMLSFFLWIQKQKFISLGILLMICFWFVFHLVVFTQSEQVIAHSIGDLYLNYFSSFLAGVFLILMFFILLLFYKKYHKRVFLIGFLIFWMEVNILTYSVYLPFTPLESINRYLVHSFVPYSIFLPIFFSLFLKKRTLIIFTILFIASNVFYSINYQRGFLEQKVNPIKKFYKDLKAFLPQIPKGSILYFDIADDEISQSHYRDFFSVASMPDTTAIALRYGLDRYDFQKTENYEDLKNPPAGGPKEKIFSFFYSKNGLENTTDKLKQKTFLTLAPKTNFQNLLISPVTPIRITVTAKAKIEDHIPLSSCLEPISDQEFKDVFKYLSARDNFLKNVKVSTNSFVDGNINTFWRGSRGFWLENNIEIITLDLGEDKNISQLLWVNRFGNSTPLKYKVEVSLDGKEWKTVKEVRDGNRKKEFEVTVEDFNLTLTRFVRFIMTDTFDKDAPALSEIEVVEDKFKIVDKQKAWELLKNPTKCVDSQNKVSPILDFGKLHGVTFYIVWKTNKHSGYSDSNTKTIALIPDGQFHDYEIIFPAGGTKFEELKLGPGVIPLSLEISKISLENVIENAL